MEGFLIFVGILAGIGYLLNDMRKREQEKFMDADMVDFHHFREQQKQEEEPDPLIARAEAYAALNPDVVTLKKPQEPELDPLVFTDAPDPTLFELRDQVFDEVTRNMLMLFHRVLPHGVNVLLDVSLSDFVKNDGSSLTNLDTTKVAYLMVETADMKIVCGAQHRDAGVTGRQSIDTVKQVFGDINIPLVEFPVSNDISEHEVHDKLDPILIGKDSQSCPKCGESMAIRKAVKGKNAGNIFWVCTNFPGCKGVVRA
ncbi:MAG: topoisomerase DNA-binding C4 zinc finger domain-containing protein [Pseudomonadales bacterium]|nr:topoisomerase DNA-binding C4 zinc finger domain-containing protein [Pseudomonadales bacterium]MBO6655661.1 topoisomerase DNA-binding C4 zinc finger domain-containing protein [Pseudomonadales bacterium]MBO6702092.1 topoisomerase DNA-binding C4 zinc finger domain-containing protein [Pseudomonadales bacterium]MBO7006625.1 topoisomerase DNA-binding C4 zinc finger domain-containing protein [Pseudomonadales bacterium]